VKPTPKRTITREVFSNFLAWLNAAGDPNGEEYEQLRCGLCNFFSQRHCRFAEDLADETIDRVIVTVSGARIENPVRYCYGVAKNVYREFLRQERRHVSVEDIVLTAEAPTELTFGRECLERCLAELSGETRSLILNYYSEVKHAKIDLHRRTSKTLFTTQTALRMRIMRIKQKLRMRLQECMNSDGIA
jgi:DNA-directed RNA polymerase specialized sigma24 family protein